MSKHIADQLDDRRSAIVNDARQIAGRALAFDRDLTETEQRRFDELIAEAEKIKERADAIRAGEQEARDVAQFLNGAPATEARQHPLTVTPQALSQVQAALEGRAVVRVDADTREERAALATGTFGAARAWGSNVPAAPRLLHVAAGVPVQGVDAAYAQFPTLTLPSAQASVGENVSLGEYATSTAGSVTLARYGRWTDISNEALLGADAGALTGMHLVGIAKDLDKTLIDAVETAAGSAVAFTSDVPAAIRKAMAQVIDNTAAEDASRLVVLVHPDNAALLEAVNPISGSTIGEGFQKFSGAMVYASSAVDTGFMTVANLQAGTRFFEARKLGLQTDLAPKTDTLTLASSIIGGYGVGLTGGFAVKVDVVTP